MPAVKLESQREEGSERGLLWNGLEVQTSAWDPAAGRWQCSLVCGRQVQVDMGMQGTAAMHSGVGQPLLHPEVRKAQGAKRVGVGVGRNPRGSYPRNGFPQNLRRNAIELEPKGSGDHKGHRHPWLERCLQARGFEKEQGVDGSGVCAGQGRDAAARTLMRWAGRGGSDLQSRKALSGGLGELMSGGGFFSSDCVYFLCEVRSRIISRERTGWRGTCVAWETGRLGSGMASPCPWGRGRKPCPPSLPVLQDERQLSSQTLPTHAQLASGLLSCHPDWENPSVVPTPLPQSCLEIAPSAQSDTAGAVYTLLCWALKARDHK